jgi:THO complex subunit 1
VFCGRVFIFLFQSFPLGDKSSVNLRGEYHTENVTTFDESPKVADSADSAMEVDSNVPLGDSVNTETSTTEQDTTKHPVSDSSKTPSLVIPSTRENDSKQPLDMDTLYPIFWNLQANFSAPTRLFDAQHFASFKEGLEATLLTFQQVRTALGGRGISKGQEELRRGTKRKRMGDGTEMTSSFNPKYLTNRDLFELEVCIVEWSIGDILTRF